MVETDNSGFWDTLGTGLSCTCPKCHKGPLFPQGIFSLDLLPSCSACQLDFTKNDSADGPAVFLIFILGFLFVPIALATEAILHPPLWAHGIVWSILILGSILISLKPLKSYIILLQYKHRPGDWE